MFHLLSLLGGDFYPEGDNFMNSISNITVGLEGALGAFLNLFLNLQTGEYLPAVHTFREPVRTDARAVVFPDLLRIFLIDVRDERCVADHFRAADDHPVQGRK